MIETKSLKNSRSIDLDSAAAIENDETMIINSDHSIITTPVSTPMTDQTVVDSSSSHDETKTMHLLQVESDETPTSDASSCEQPVIGEKGKRHRTKARSDSNRSEKYEKQSLHVVSSLSLLSICFLFPSVVQFKLVRIFRAFIDFIVCELVVDSRQP